MVAVGFAINGLDQIIDGVFLGSNLDHSYVNKQTMAPADNDSGAQARVAVPLGTSLELA
jgi:hypothetical protein